jgi:homoserine O-succinyltransferase
VTTLHLRIGVVDLMPKPGLAHQQFGAMIETAGAERGLHVELHALPLPPETALVDPRFCGIDWETVAAMDALIVTGTEPRAAELPADPMRALVGHLLEVTGQVASTIFSCFSAHAALSILHSLDRTGLPEKRRGVFPHDLCSPGHPLIQGLSAGAPAPHSRWNRIGLDHLVAAGVAPVLTLPSDDDWYLATSSDGLRYLFLQGHPEYHGDTLFREYRRDVRRYLSGQNDRYPVAPEFYLDQQAIDDLLAFRETALDDRDPELMARFPSEGLIDRCRSSWDDDAKIFTGNWLSAVAGAIEGSAAAA